MAKKVDITEKLSFDGNPSLVIKGKELEVHADAATALKVMDALSSNPGPKQVVAMYKLLFPDESRKAIDKMRQLDIIKFNKRGKDIQIHERLHYCNWWRVSRM